MRATATASLFVLAATTDAFAVEDPASVADNGEVLIGRVASGERLPNEAADEPLLVAIDTPYQVFDDAGTLIHVAAWTLDGRPASRAHVYLAGHLVGRADDTGSFVFRWGVPGNDVDDYWTNGSQVAVRWTDDDTTHGGEVWFSAFSRTQSFESDHLFVYTDRGVYAPGDSIRMRLVGWHLAADYTPLTGAGIDATLVAPDGSVAGGLSMTTDDLGVAWAELTVPPSSDEGVYTLRVAHEGATAETRLRVERFVAPTIDIKHDLPRFVTRDQADLEWEVTLAYFTGGAPARATITADARLGDETLWTTTTAVDGAGPHAMSIPASDLDALRDQLHDGVTFDLRLTVEDDLGRVDELTRDIRYVVNPYVGVIEADRDAYTPGDPVELIVRLTDIDRVPVRDTDVRLVTSDGEAHRATTDDGGTAQVSFVMGEHEISVELYLEGVDAPIASRWLSVQPAQPMRSHVADAVVTEDEIVPVRVTFPAEFRPVERWVHVDVVDTSGSLVDAVLLEVGEDDGEVVATGEFRAPSWGSMLLTLFSLGEREGDATRFSELDDDHGRRTHLGLLTEGQNVVVHPGRELQILLDGVPDTAAPGEHVEPSIRVVDANGDPVDAAVGVAVVDEAVISLKDPLEITPMDHFYNPELRTISTTGSAILTWPVVSRNWGPGTHDIALPPFPFREGGHVAMPGRHQGQGFFGEGDYAFDDSTIEGQMLEAEDGEFYGVGVGSVGTGYGGGGMAAQPAPMITGAIGAPPAEPSPDYAGEDADMTAVARTRGDRHAEAPAPVTITIRTELPETALWLPDLRAADGRADFALDLPDAISGQQISVVASDGRGGVGVERLSVRVTQPIFVQPDLPPVITLGDIVEARVAVQNLADEPTTATVSLESDGLTQIAEAPPIDVPAGGAALARLLVRAERAGEVTWRARAETPTAVDIEERTLWVAPRGAPTLATYEGSVSAEHAFSRAIGVPTGGDLATVTLDVAFPAVTAAFAGLDAMGSRLREDDLTANASDLVSALLVYEYKRSQGDLDGAGAWKDELQAALDHLIAAQGPDGGWRFWWDENPNPYITAWCLEALTEGERLGFDVDATAGSGAVDALMTALVDEGVDLSGIAFWEGDVPTVQAALRAEILHVLARAPQAWLSAEDLVVLADRVEEAMGILDAPAADVSTLAHTLAAAVALRGRGAVELSAERLDAAVVRLVERRENDHWEPSWFNAYGGTIEATVVTLELLRDADSERFDLVARDAIRYLLSTRDAWGSWHNERGTAWAIRGILLVGVGPEEAASTVAVRVDGDVVAEVAIDPADPYLSAASLRALDLTPWADEGRHEIEVDYDGNLEPTVRVIVRHWAGEAVASNVDFTGSGRVSTDPVAVGGDVSLQVSLRADGDGPRTLSVSISVPPTLAVDGAALDALAESGVIGAVARDEAAVVFSARVPGGREPLELALPFRATRPGIARFADAEVSGEGGVERATLVVEGAVEVR